MSSDGGAGPGRARTLTGSLDRLGTMTGTGIAPREVVVWKPPGYENGGRNASVLYMHDGQNLFDPRTSYLGIDWRMDESAGALIRTARMAEAIIVGIYATDDRLEEYGDTRLGRAYLRFITHELKPRIDGAYRTRPDRTGTAVMGSSMGGLSSFLAVWHHPDVFSAAACLSPVFPPMTIRRVEQEPWDHEPLKLYIDNGGDEMDTSLQPGIDAMLAALAGRGFSVGRDLVWFRDRSAPHNEDGWADRAWRPLLFMFGKERT